MEPSTVEMGVERRIREGCVVVYQIPDLRKASTLL